MNSARATSHVLFAKGAAVCAKEHWEMKIPLFALMLLAASSVSARDVSLTAYRPIDGQTRSLAALQVDLRYQSVRTAPSETLQDLLSRNGIYLDGEALGLIYDLNPHLQAATPPAGSTLTVPIAIGGNDWRAAREAGFLIAVTRDADLKRQLLQQVDRLENTAQRFVTSQAVLRLEQDSRRTLVESLKVTVDALVALKTTIEQRTWPFPQRVLAHAKGESESLNNILDRNIASSKPIPVADREVAELIAESMRIRTEVLQEERGAGQLPKRWPEIRIRVMTRFAKSGNEAHALRVYYVPQALYGTNEYVESFDTLTSPSEASLSPANYIIWAGKPGDTKAMSDVKRLRARDSGSRDPVLVELIIH